jgi:hypothetical protein
MIHHQVNCFSSLSFFHFIFLPEGIVGLRLYFLCAVGGAS